MGVGYRPTDYSPVTSVNTKFTSVNSPVTSVFAALPTPRPNAPAAPNGRAPAGEECRPAQRTPARGRTGRSEERARTDRPQGEGERARAAGREGGARERGAEGAEGGGEGAQRPTPNNQPRQPDSTPHVSTSRSPQHARRFLFSA